MYLIKNCPDFPFMPSLCYDQVFFEYGIFDSKQPWEKQEWDTPACWSTKGFEVYELEECSKDESEYAIFSGGIEKVNHSCIGLYVEAVNCSKDAGKKACFVKIKDK